MFKKIGIILFFAAIVGARHAVPLQGFAYAQSSQETKARHADINKDGVVDKKERKAESAWERKRRLEADEPAERGPDLNKDGVVDGNEVRLWREKIDVDNDKVVDPGEKRLAELREESSVNTVIERKYDLDSDGDSTNNTPLSNQITNQNIEPTKKFVVGTEVRISGTVVQNITEYAPVDGPAYFNLRSDDGVQIRVTYSPGDAECRNAEVASDGFAVKANERVEVFAKAISDKELFTCESTNYYIKRLNESASQQNAGNQNLAFSLDFFAGGSIFGSSLEVKISGATITYRETTEGGGKEVQKIERVLLPSELTDIQKTIADAKLTTLQSQDFTKEPLVPDQASYRISVSLDGKENTIHCGISPSGTQPTTNCQKQIDKLRLKLNSILGVDIY